MAETPSGGTRDTPQAGPTRTGRFTLADLRRARSKGRRVAMLTCYDYSTARVMADAGVRMLLVGDSAANVVLGHATTLPVSLDFLIDICAAVRRGAPDALIWFDLPFASTLGGRSRASQHVARAMQLSGADGVKIETGETSLPLVRDLADAGVAVVAHLGLRPQSVGRLGGAYATQGRTPQEAERIVRLGERFAGVGAAAILLEAVPPSVAEAVVNAVDVPVIGCGAGPACCGHVVVAHDLLGYNPCPPRFVPRIDVAVSGAVPAGGGSVAEHMRATFAEYVRLVEAGVYPAAEHSYTSRTS